MKSLKGLLFAVLADAEAACSVRTHRDALTCALRLEHEGASFLTITLPNLGDWFDQSLEYGEALTQTAFKKSRTGALPRFLSGLLGLVFDSDGVLLPVDQIDPNAVFYVRQVCRMFKKINMECTESRKLEALAGYGECDAEVGKAVKDATYRIFAHVSRIVCADVLGGYGYQQVMPRHGPGAVLEKGTTPNSKYKLKTWTSRLEPVLPSSDFLLANYSWRGEPGLGFDEFDSLLSVKEEPAVKVTTVPKTMKGPRVIAIEPTHMQFAQQGIAGWLVSRIETCDTTRGHVNFSSQEINAGLALRHSRDRGLCTIDLSEASDRVSIALVGTLLAVHPWFRKTVFACRSQKALLPNGVTMRLRKFASMGSALCFPVESLVFYCLVVASLHQQAGIRVTPKSIRSLGKDVYIYGDDILAPAARTEGVIEFLEAVGLKVNRAKTFFRGNFRESCGMDAFNGYRVTPVYVREYFDGDRSPTVLVSWISLRNQLYKAGCWRAAAYVQTCVEETYSSQPYVQSTSPGLGWHSNLGYDQIRWCDKLHVPLVYATVVVPRKRRDEIDGHPALMKYFLSPSKEREEHHLKRTVMRDAIRIQRRWVPAF